MAKSCVVRFAGLRTDPQNFLNAMDIFVLPSEFESFSLACAEAMYLKTPVIVFNGSGGCEELVTSAGGFVAQDEKHLASLLHDLMTQKELLKQASHSGYHYVVRHHSMQVCATRFQAYYDALTGKTHSRLALYRAGPGLQ